MHVTNGDILVKSIPIEIWLTGDLLFLVMAQGCEGASTHWCILYDQIRNIWSL